MATFKKRLTTTAIFVHCAATPPSLNADVRLIRQWHKQQGWLDIGYHYVIKRDGTVEDGRPVETIGAHASGENSTSIGVCLAGGVNTKGEPDANFTYEQYSALVILLVQLKKQFPDVKEIRGHRDVANKACPSFDIHGLLENFNKVIK